MMRSAIDQTGESEEDRWLRQKIDNLISENNDAAVRVNELITQKEELENELYLV